ncbi:MAG: transmembrane Mn(2+) transporter [Planctomycetota bacterium]|nr:transmembrane Mn(2+) transporter [Planctomycetota bacterium]
MSTARRLGPGLIVAGSIVGSGELIATTKVGAEAGFSLLWLIVIGCVVKVFTQVEFGRSAVCQGRSALRLLDDLPGPRWRGSWAVWLWVAMTLLTLAQQGGIVGGVGQALAMAAPLTEAGAGIQGLQDDLVGLQVRAATQPLLVDSADALVESQRLQAEISARGGAPDAIIWAAILTAPTAVVLVIGRFTLIQLFATAMVVAFTIVTVLTVVLLQRQPSWAIGVDELLGGLSGALPEVGDDGRSPTGTALAAFGIIGVGAAELVMYPYWCLEKGYAKWTGSAEDSDTWRARARGWLRVMQWDAWMSAVVYTFATVAFFLLGAAVLGRAGLNPEKGAMVRTLAQMYVPVFGEWARPMFLVGAFCVLYSTFFVASAGLARIAADCVIVLGVTQDTAAARRRWTRAFSGLLPVVSFGVFAWIEAPAQLVLAGGVAQALMLPVLGFGALWARYRWTPRGLQPGGAWDIALWVSSGAFVVVSGWSLARL